MAVGEAGLGLVMVVEVRRRVVVRGMGGMETAAVVAAEEGGTGTAEAKAAEVTLILEGCICRWQNWCC